MTTTSDNALKKPSETVPFPDLTRVSELNGNVFSEAAKFNAHVGNALQNLGKEWSEFVGTRLREDVQMVRTVYDCRSLQDLQHAYAQFWQTAFTQYGEQAQKMMRVTQGAMDDARHATRELREAVMPASKAA